MIVHLISSIRRLAAAAAALCLFAPVAGAAPRVAATVAPVHSLATAVTEGVSTPYLLVRAGASPHAYAMTPSDSRALSEADLIVWVGESLEVFLKKPLAVLGANARKLRLETLAGIETLPRRPAGARHRGEAHGQDHDHDSDIDPHLWLSTRNAETILHAIARELAAIDPANAGRYAENARRAAARLAVLRRDVAAVLAPVRHRPFIVFHDAWQYFEQEFGLESAGVIAVNPERKPGARRLVEVRQRIAEANVRCVFAEPQFSPALVATVVRGTGARSGTLDPLGARHSPGPGLYGAMMRALARDFASCLNEPPQ